MAVGQSVVAIAKVVLTGTDSWQDILNSWKIKKSKYYDIYTKKDGDSFNVIDMGILPLIIPIKVMKIKDTMCVTTLSLFGYYLPVGCKYISEPYPDSIYGNFMSLNSNADKDKDTPCDPRSLVDCGLSSNSCYQRAYNNSKTAIVITAPLIECIK